MQVFGHGARISSLGDNFVTREDDGFGSPAEPHQFPGCRFVLSCFQSSQSQLDLMSIEY